MSRVRFPPSALTNRIRTVSAPIATHRYFDLGPTATYRRRRAGWFPGRGDRGDDRIGTLRIVLQKGKQPRDSDDVDEYGLQEELGTDVPLGARSFLLRNDTDFEQPDVYRAVIYPAFPTASQCTCRAGSCRLDCKHTAAMAAIVAAGLLPPSPTGSSGGGLRCVPSSEVSSVKMTYTESQFEMPNGKYLARFLGVANKELKPGEKPKLGQDGNPLPPAMTWNFEIIDGDQTGKRADRLTGRIPTPGSGCGKMLVAICDRVLETGDEVDLDPFVGKVYRITVIDNRISDSPAPILVHDYKPATTTNANTTTTTSTGLPTAADPNARWDFSDGATVMMNQTSGQVQLFLTETKTPPTAIRVKPAGAPREAAKTADQWGFKAAEAPKADPIPF